MKILIQILLFLSLTVQAAPNLETNLATNLKEKAIAAKEFQHEQLQFDFISSDGGYWYDCKHVKESQPHSWTVYCGRYVFKLHLLLIQYHRENESTYEFHYWAGETSVLKETHTQSTWLTVDQNAKPKKIIGYLGFTQDASQLRIEVRP
jgi:hypothetical protein